MIFAILLAAIIPRVFADDVSINTIPDKYRGDSVTISGNTTFARDKHKGAVPEWGPI